jgi:predicted enzyme related to lactoylglutathione lyase
MPEFAFILLPVADPIASAAFYARLLGRQAVETTPTFAMLSLRDGVMLGLWQRDGMQPPAPATPGGSEIAFLAPDIDATHAEWHALGTTIAQPPTNMDFGRTFTALDPDGNRLRVFKPAA